MKRCSQKNENSLSTADYESTKPKLCQAPLGPSYSSFFLLLTMPQSPYDPECNRSHMNCVYWQWFYKAFSSPCSNVRYMTVANLSHLYLSVVFLSGSNSTTCTLCGRLSLYFCTRWDGNPHRWPGEECGRAHDTGRDGGAGRFKVTAGPQFIWRMNFHLQKPAGMSTILAKFLCFPARCFMVSCKGSLFRIFFPFSICYSQERSLYLQGVANKSNAFTTSYNIFQAFLICWNQHCAHSVFISSFTGTDCRCVSR